MKRITALSMMFMSMALSAMDSLNGLTLQQRQARRDMYARAIAKKVDDFKQLPVDIHKLIGQMVMDGYHRYRILVYTQNIMANLSTDNIILERYAADSAVLDSFKFSPSQAYIAYKSDKGRYNVGFNTVDLYRIDTGEKIIEHHLADGEELESFSFINKSHVLKIVVRKKDSESRDTIYMSTDFRLKLTPQQIMPEEDEEVIDSKKIAQARLLAKEALGQKLEDTDSSDSSDSDSDKDENDPRYDKEHNVRRPKSRAGIVAVSPDYCFYIDPHGHGIILNLKHYVTVRDFLLQPPTLELAAVFYKVFENHCTFKVKYLDAQERAIYDAQVPEVMKRILAIRENTGKRERKRAEKKKKENNDETNEEDDF